MCFANRRADPTGPVSSPHNFLRPTPAMENQIKVRDWIVARIVKVEEDVVDSKVRSLQKA